MKKTLIGALLLCVGSLFGQAPKLYIHLVSHNEPTDNLDAPPGINYHRAKNNLLRMAAIVHSKNVKWNLQTSDGLVMGALNYDAAGTSSTDIFETLASPPYNNHIEIDPRSKNSGGRNIADQWYLLDSIGANPSHTVGGFLWYICQPSSMQPDWWRYQDTLTGNVYGNKVKFNLLSGAGSAGSTLHCNDLNDFGVFKPDTITHFYQHNPSRNVWCIGTGCAPVLDSLSDEQAIIDLIQGQVDSIQNGLWPADKFYVTRIMTNQREYGPRFFQKILKVIDSLNLIPSTQLQWATIGEAFAEFQNWQISSGQDYSLWNCDHDLYTGLEEKETPKNQINICPNPAADFISICSTLGAGTIRIYDTTGRQVLQMLYTPEGDMDVSALANGFYWLQYASGNGFAQAKFLKI